MAGEQQQPPCVRLLLAVPVDASSSARVKPCCTRIVQLFLNLLPCGGRRGVTAATASSSALLTANNLPLSAIYPTVTQSNVAALRVCCVALSWPLAEAAEHV
jgi:hypothetical protein